MMTKVLIEPILLIEFERDGERACAFLRKASPHGHQFDQEHRYSASRHKSSDSAGVANATSMMAFTCFGQYGIG